MTETDQELCEQMKLMNADGTLDRDKQDVIDHKRRLAKTLASFGSRKRMETNDPIVDAMQRNADMMCDDYEEVNLQLSEGHKTDSNIAIKEADEMNRLLSGESLDDAKDIDDDDDHKDSTD